MLKTRRCSMEQLEDRFALTSQLFMDVNDKPVLGIARGQHAELNGKVLFVAGDPIHGREVWFTDGTEAGTSLLKDLPGNPGDLSSIQFLHVDSEQLYFTRNHRGGKHDLWVTNGTENGTHAIAQGDSSYNNLALLKGSALFQPYGGRYWVSDGTSQGTRSVDADFSSANFTSSIVFNERLFFAAHTVENGVELWSADAHSARLEFEIRHGSVSSNPDAFVIVGSELWFTADGDQGRPVWWSLTEEGNIRQLSTQAVAPVRASVVYDGEVYFRARNSIWTVNRGGEVAAKFEMHENDHRQAGFFHVASDELFFSAASSFSRSQVWRTDGEEFHLVLDAEASVLGDKIVSQHIAYDSKTDHSASITNRFHVHWLGVTNQIAVGACDGGLCALDLNDSVVKDITPQLLQTSSSDPVILGVIDGKLLFIANEAKRYEQWRIWATNGTRDGTYVIADGEAKRCIGNWSPCMRKLHIDNRIFFSVDDRSIWVTDGTTRGSRPLIRSRYLEFIGQYNGNALVSSRDGVWVTDGTWLGTKLIPDTRGFGQSTVIAANDSLVGFFQRELRTINLRSGQVEAMKVHNPSMIVGSATATHHFFFGTSEEGGSDEEIGLWKTDGTLPGTKLVMSFSASDLPRARMIPAVLGDVALFTLSDALWRTDGTLEGTYILLERTPARAVDIFGDELYLIDETGTLWRTDGRNTTRVASGFSTTPGEPGAHSWVRDDELLIGGNDVWRTDGTEEGTWVVMSDIYKSRQIGVIDNQLFAAKRHDAKGIEIFVVDLAMGQVSADLDQDGLVGFSDFLVLSANFGRFANANDGDLDGSGRVTFVDFLLLSQQFGELI